MDAEATSLAQTISHLLDEAKYTEAVGLANDNKHAEVFKNGSWELIPAIVAKVQNNTITIAPALHSACEKLLTAIVDKANAEEVLLELIELTETAKNDAQFLIVLDPMQRVLGKLKNKRNRSLEWCFNSISTYLENIPTPEHNLEGRERVLMDSDDNIRRIEKVYSHIPEFYNLFIDEIIQAGSNASKESKKIIAAFLIGLLGKPLIHLDVETQVGVQSAARKCCQVIINDICKLEKDVLKLLDVVTYMYKENLNKRKNSLNDECNDPYLHTEKLTITSLSGLVYIALAGDFELPDHALPQVYSAEYIVHTSLLAVVHFLTFTAYGPLTKGLSLCKALLVRLSKPVSHSLLAAPVHSDLIKGLVYVAVFSTYEKTRKDAVTLIGFHVNIFDYKGRCILVKRILEMANHSGIIGYAITLYKNSIDEVFKSQGKFPECFVGPQLMEMLKKIVFLPNGAESDLVVLADQIITALNFIIYLSLKDFSNVTRFRDYFPFLQQEFFEKLRMGLNMSKAHYEVKLKDIEEGVQFPERKVDVSINVGGNILDDIPVENQKQVINSALNAFHLMEGLLARASECISVDKSKRQMGILTARYSQDTRRVKQIDESTNHTETDDHQYEEDVKNRILMKALELVHKSGWSTESLSAGAEAAGYPGIAHGLFPNGSGDLVHYFNLKCNETLVTEMKNWPRDDVGESKVPTKFVENAIVSRLQMIQPYKNSWPKAMAIQALPSNVPNSLATLLSLVDDICYHSGDRSVDFNWYVRRVGLAGIYKTAELFFLTDTSPEHNATRKYVASRIRDAQLIQTAFNMSPASSAAPQALTAAFVTAKNILGLNTISK